MLLNLESLDGEILQMQVKSLNELFSAIDMSDWYFWHSDLVPEGVNTTLIICNKNYP